MDTPYPRSAYALLASCMEHPHPWHWYTRASLKTLRKFATAPVSSVYLGSEAPFRGDAAEATKVSKDCSRANDCEQEKQIQCSLLHLAQLAQNVAMSQAQFRAQRAAET
mmetsp:Transcript_18235/g.41940  ORF Transcript_18235/g.41940 Transcript_18235/m.41940 type:complete len:109 (-) Transcript_18235:8-334(-)